ncbi:hypothetical protein KGM48_01865 [Patescibacteria group bacterium]|nr:hypothetical protein [Patescibacteria group bacterium]
MKSEISLASISSARSSAAAIMSADLSFVAVRVAKDHPDWSQERIGAALAEYREYLAYISANRNLYVLPPLDGDEVWHAHILHTREYEAFCKENFGQFLHHVPNPDPAMNVKRFGNLNADCCSQSSCAWWSPDELDSRPTSVTNN